MDIQHQTLFMMVGAPLDTLTHFTNRVFIPSLVQALGYDAPVVADFLQCAQRVATRATPPLSVQEARKAKLPVVLGMMFEQIRDGAGKGRPLVLIRENATFENRARALLSVPINYRRVAVELYSLKRGLSTVQDPVNSHEGFDEVWRFTYDKNTLEYNWLSGGWQLADEPERPSEEQLQALVDSVSSEEPRT